jgi:hypothetical protein
MNLLMKFAANVGLLVALASLPLSAQTLGTFTFTAPFSFYVGTTKLPSGSYRITQPDDLDLTTVVVTGIDGRHSAAIFVTTTESQRSASRSMVLFDKYGSTLFLRNIVCSGELDGMEIAPTKLEKKARELASNGPVSTVAIAGD